jgi:hypothetical protein
MVVLDRLETWDESWKNGYKVATTGLIYPLVRADRFPSFEEWVERDRQAIANYDPGPALRFPQGSWEQMVGQLALNMQAARAHIALVYAGDAGNAEAPARWAVTLLEQVVRRAGGSTALGIAAEEGLRPLDLHATLFKHLGIGYELLSHSDPSFLARTVKAWELFAAKAPAGDADLPSVRAYLQKAGAIVTP